MTFEYPTIDRDEPLVDRRVSDPNGFLEDDTEDEKCPHEYNTLPQDTNNSENNHTEMSMMIVRRQDMIDDGQDSSTLNLYGHSTIPEWTPINLNWSKKILELVGNKAKLMESFSWLSTVGGGFSALGERDSKWSARAGTLSLGQQLHLAELLGDERLKVMCHLFAALAALQMNNKQFCINYIRMSTQFVGHQHAAIEQADNKENQTPPRINRTTNKIRTTKVSR